MITQAQDILLNVQPVFFEIRHLYRYEGPCRSGVGDQLEPEFDLLRNEEWWNTFTKDMETRLPPCVNVMEPLRFTRTDNWDDDESMWEEIGRTTAEADFYIFHSFLGLDGLVVEFAERFGKPCCVEPEYINPCSATSIGAALAAHDKAYEFYGFRNWADLSKQLEVLRARKVIRNTKILLPVRFSSSVSMSSVDAFPDQTAITEKLGIRFRPINLHELLDQMSPAVPGGNPTTPGRDTWDITDEDMAEAERLTDELIAEAEEVDVDRKWIMNSVIAYLTVRKQMCRLDCNGFTAPCPDSCSTRRLHEQGFTFCFTHSLFMRQGIPSSCEFDTCTVASQQALIAMTGMNPYMGNTFPVVKEDGQWVTPLGVEEEDLPKLEENEGSLYVIHHSVPHNRMRHPEENGPYALRHFSEDKGFGAVFRYNFNADEGQQITLCRIAPDGERMFIGRGWIVCDGGYNLHNCNGEVVFKVEDQKDFYEKQLTFGNHLAMVYGDYVDDMAALAHSMNMDVVIA